MKKIFSVLAVVFSVGMFAQSSLTWVMKEKANETYFTKTEFTCSIAGISSPKEAADLQQKMKNNADLSSVKDMGKDANGNYQFNVVMKSPQSKIYYLNWASNVGISYIMTLKGEKKTIQEVIAANQRQQKPSDQHPHTH